MVAKRTEPKPPCSIPECGAIEYLRGMCGRHYSSWRRYGDPLKATPQHGHAGSNVSRAYRCWHNMITRCTSPTNPNYPLYGGRGITIDPRWLDFTAFLADMGEPPDGLTLERKDNNGNYEPSNCKWATPLEQGNNRRTNRMFLFQGAQRTLAELARIADMPYSTIRWRLTVLNWDVEQAVSLPKGDKWTYSKHLHQ